MNIKVIAAILLVERLLAVTLMLFVVRKQLSLFKRRADQEIHRFRKLLFALALVITASNFIPIVIDALTLFANLEYRDNPQPIGILYAISNATTAVISAAALLAIYRLAGNNDNTSQDF